MKSPSLECFFVDLRLPVDKIDGYLSRLSAMGVDNEHDLRCFASIWNLKKIGMCDRDIQNIMQNLFIEGIEAADESKKPDHSECFSEPRKGASDQEEKYMNTDSIQNMLAEGKRFDDNAAAVLEFSVLNALIELHSRNILVRDSELANILCENGGRIKLNDFGVTKDMLDENQCTDRFFEILAYMSPTQVRGNPYSFKADVWGLGITMIAIMTGRPPFPTGQGPRNLMNATVQGPRLTLESDSVSAELHSFTYDDRTYTTNHLDHSTLSSRNSSAFLQHPAFSAPTAGVSVEDFDEIVEAAISWQLDRFYSTISEEGKIHEGPFDKLPRFTTDKIRGLSQQMLLEPSILEEKFTAKYTEIDALISKKRSMVDLRKIVWPDKKSSA